MKKVETTVVEYYDGEGKLLNKTITTRTVEEDNNFCVPRPYTWYGSPSDTHKPDILYDTYKVTSNITHDNVDKNINIKM